EQSWRPCAAGVFHPGKTPKRIALIDQVEWAIGLQRAADLLVCADTPLLAQGQVSLRRCRQRVQSNSARHGSELVHAWRRGRGQRWLARFRLATGGAVSGK